jgi:sugar lactone lactonase YvrE
MEYALLIRTKPLALQDRRSFVNQRIPRLFILLLVTMTLMSYACGRISVPSAPLAPSTCSNGGVVSTLAGGGACCAVDGAGSVASFATPVAIAVDSSGNVYVSEYFNNTIRKITPAGVVSTIAGTAMVVGSANGTGPAASFNYPYGITVDTTGNIYVADSGNQLIRKITAGGVVTTLAGSVGVVGSANGTGTAATFNWPLGLSADPSGNIYVADYGNSMIRKITPGGVVSTVAGSAGVTGTTNGAAASALFNGPWGVAVDSSGNLFVSDTNNFLVREIDTTGMVTTVAGSAGVTGVANGAGASALFNYAQGLTVDPCGNIFVADTANDTIREITGGVVTTLAGSAGVTGVTNGTGAAGTFWMPYAVAADSSGVIYVADAMNQRVRKVQ